MVVTRLGLPGRPALRSADKGWRKDGATVTTQNQQTVGEDVEEPGNKLNRVTVDTAGVCNIVTAWEHFWAMHEEELNYTYVILFTIASENNSL